MVAFGQYIIIGLASTVYLAGAVFLLAGCSLVPIGANEEGKCPSTVVRGIPYFYPVAEKDLGEIALTGTSLPEGEVQVRTSCEGPHLGHQAVGHKNETVAGLLMEPLCLN